MDVGGDGAGTHRRSPRWVIEETGRRAGRRNDRVGRSSRNARLRPVSRRPPSSARSTPRSLRACPGPPRSRGGPSHRSPATRRVGTTAPPPPRAPPCASSLREVAPGLVERGEPQLGPVPPSRRGALGPLGQEGLQHLDPLVDGQGEGVPRILPAPPCIGVEDRPGARHGQRGDRPRAEVVLGGQLHGRAVRAQRFGAGRPASSGGPGGSGDPASHRAVTARDLPR